MKTPEKLLQELSDKSLTENQPIEQWLEYLEDPQQEVNHDMMFGKEAKKPDFILRDQILKKNGLLELPMDELLGIMKSMEEYRSSGNPESSDSGWISVETRKPDHSRDVLAKLKDNTRLMGRFFKDKKNGYWKLYFSDNGMQFDQYRSDQVIEWMELP